MVLYTTERLNQSRLLIKSLRQKFVQLMICNDTNKKPQMFVYNCQAQLR
jgi:hypothetical protein